MNAIAAQPMWTDEEEQTLSDLYSVATWNQMLEALPGRTKRAIWNRAHRLGLPPKKYDIPPETRARMAQLARERKPRLGKVVHPVVVRDGVPSKCCTECQEWQPVERFARHKGCSGGRRAICTTCEGRKAYQSNRERCIKQVSVLPAVIGSGDDCDVQLEDLPPEALRLTGSVPRSCRCPPGRRR